MSWIFYHHIPSWILCPSWWNRILSTSSEIRNEAISSSLSITFTTVSSNINVVLGVLKRMILSLNSDKSEKFEEQISVYAIAHTTQSVKMSVFRLYLDHFIKYFLINKFYLMLDNKKIVKKYREQVFVSIQFLFQFSTFFHHFYCIETKNYYTEFKFFKHV